MTQLRRIVEWASIAMLALACASGSVNAQATHSLTLGARHMALPVPQVGATISQTDVMATVLSDAADAINAATAKAIATLAEDPQSRSGAFTLGRAATLGRQIDEIAARAQLKVRPYTSLVSEDSVRRGQAQSIRNLRQMGVRLVARGSQTGERSGLVADFAVVNQRAVQLAVQDITYRLNRTVRAHADNAKAVFRSLSTGPLSGSLREAETSRIIARGIITGDPREAMRAMRRQVGENIGFAELDRYRKLGNQLIEVGNATMSVRNYSEMVVRTRTREAMVQGSIEQQVELGFDLGQIVGANSANFCTRFLGLVVVLSGPGRDGFPGIDELPDGPPPFHPLCSKSVAPYDVQLSSRERTRTHEARLDQFRRDQAAGRLTEDLRAKRSAA